MHSRARPLPTPALGPQEPSKGRVQPAVSCISQQHLFLQPKGTVGRDDLLTNAEPQEPRVKADFPGMTGIDTVPTVSAQISPQQFHLPCKEAEAVDLPLTLLFPPVLNPILLF